jgi:hypothetical protein
LQISCEQPYKLNAFCDSLQGSETTTGERERNRLRADNIIVDIKYEIVLGIEDGICFMQHLVTRPQELSRSERGDMARRYGLDVQGWRRRIGIAE